jgi:DNA-binding transcriptional ArsR family regulator
MEEFLSAVRALGDSNRVRALLSLREGELCLCQIIELLGLAPSTVSKHMSILKQAGLVDSRKEERWIYYRLAKYESKHPIARFIEISINTLAEDEIIKKDDEKLKKILRMTPETLCKVNKSK